MIAYKKIFIPALACLLTCAELNAEEFVTVGDKFTSRHMIENHGKKPQPQKAYRPLSPAALALIKSFEGWMPHLYNDAAGYCTIGFGHLVALHKCHSASRQLFPSPLSQKEGLKILKKDTRQARIDVEEMVVHTKLTPHQYGALTSLIFNIGAGNFKKSSLLKTLNDKEKPHETRIALAAQEFLRWRKAGGVVLEGLSERRRCEAALFLGLHVKDENGNFDQRLCMYHATEKEIIDCIDIHHGE